MLSEISQTEKDKYCMISLIRGIQNIRTQTHTHSQKKRPDLLPEAGTGVGVLEEDGQKGETSSYKMNKHQGCRYSW